MTTPRIEQVQLPSIPWQTVQSAIKVAFGNDAQNWQIQLVEAVEAIPAHITVTPATTNPNAKGKVKPTFLVFANHIPQPSGSNRLVYHVWGHRRGIQGNQVVDIGHSLIATVSHYCDVAAAIALHWQAMEVDQRLKVAFDEPEPTFDFGDSAFDGGHEEGGNSVLVNFQTGEVKPDSAGSSNFTDYTF